ncbi:hypothetical protein OG819_47225 [Streptomyces sp. NBC_01549]|uniref:hypothetical protein n=1 Tax=unclassified Streptomyces TaxID=2593676 RepID=UPI00225841AA|nr:hypothetical protein [Streptomyces sp. NBC_01549]MCX4596960.1 hypothetical protein [Streptomyces sp. NBC_01549]
MGNGRPPIEVHVGGCYAAGKRRRPRPARRSTPPPHLGRARLHALQARRPAPHPRLTARGDAGDVAARAGHGSNNSASPADILSVR